MLYRLIAALLTMLAFAPAQAAERSFLVGNYQDVIVEGDIQVTLTTGLAPSAKASGDQTRLNALKIERQDRTLRIRMQGLAPTKVKGEPLKVVLTGRDIRKLVMNGNGKIAATAITLPDLRIEIRGSGEIEVASITTERLVTLLIGSGKLTLGAGAIENGDVVIDGAPVVTAQGVAMKKLKLTQSGPANIHFNVSDRVDITNSGAGTIAIDGKATCFVREAGSATINCSKRN